MALNPRELIERVIALWNVGTSAGMIAERLKVVNRNQVMGILYRARTKDGALVKRRNRSPATEYKRREKHKRGAPWRPAIAPVAKLPAVVELPVQPSTPLRLTRLALPSGRVMRWHAAGGCAFLTNDDATDPQWCNAPVVVGRSWCPQHFRLTHVRLPPRGGG